MQVKSVRSVWTWRGAIVVAALIAGANFQPAFANGGDFFEELSASWGQTDSDSGLPYFGFIKDTHGKLIPDARVSATTANGSSFVVQADAMGHYKIPGFSKSVDATKVQVSCSKVGYRLVSRDRRILRGAPKAPIETDCVLTPDASAKPAA
jgi:hypothetical protein